MPACQSTKTLFPTPRKLRGSNPKSRYRVRVPGVDSWALSNQTVGPVELELVVRGIGLDSCCKSLLIGRLYEG